MDDDQDKCPIWETVAQFGGPTDSPWVVFTSTRAGGTYKIVDSVRQKCRSLDENERLRITNWLVEERRTGTQVPFLNEANFIVAKNYRSYTVPEIVSRSLIWFAKNTPHLGIVLGLSRSPDDRIVQHFQAEVGIKDFDEVKKICDFAIHCGWLEKIQTTYDDQFCRYSLSYGGWEQVEKLRPNESESKQAFVAMWFGDEMTTIYDMAIHPAIEAAGYSPMRIDRTEHNNKIDDQIISEIRRSKFLIADFTSYEVTTKNDDGGSENHYIPRGGVYYEAGFAKGLGKDVIWTCRKDQHEKLHFDIRQYNNILWESQGELKERLQVRIEATLGEGPLKK